MEILKFQKIYIINAYVLTDQLLKIIKIFEDGASDVKPHEISKRTGIGATKKDVNAHLYQLEKKKVLCKSCQENLGNPHWNKGENFDSYAGKSKQLPQL